MTSFRTKNQQETTSTSVVVLFFFITTLVTGVEVKNTTVTKMMTTTPHANASQVTEGGQEETEYEEYLDLTNFVDGINGWDFMGAWAKYDLSKLPEGKRPLPLVPDADDQGVFICQTSTMPSSLQKVFPPLHNATFSLTFFAQASDGELPMTGEVVTPDGASETLFNYSAVNEAAGYPGGAWVTHAFTLPSLAATGSFTLHVGVRHSESGVWAAAEMRVEGETGPPLIVTTPVLPIIPTGNITTNESEVNETTTAAPPVNGTTEAPPNITTTEGGAAGGGDQDVSELQGIAQAIWDAFYVFLALFCACLVALIALIVHGRCKDDEPPPAVATYNPRTASYRMDKVYDNPSYDNNAV